MNKKQVDINVCVSILMTAFTVYSLVVFVFVKEMNSFFWCSFALTTVIFVFQIVMNEYVEAKKIDVKDVIFKIPIIATGIIFMIIQILYAILFSFIDIQDYASFFLIQFLTFALYCAIVIGSLMSSLKNVNKMKFSNSYIMFIAESIKNIEDNAKDLNSRVLIHQLYEKIKKTNLESTIESFEIELKIQNKVVNFNKIAPTCDNETLKKEIKEINKLFEERNRICRLIQSSR